MKTKIGIFRKEKGTGSLLPAISICRKTIYYLCFILIAGGLTGRVATYQFILQWNTPKAILN